MKLAIMQPYFFPYIGYFQLINAVDKFVIFDDANFINKGWINRNIILVNCKPHTFTVPLKNASQNELIKDLKLAIDDKWKTKFIRMLELSYKKAPYFNKTFGIVENVINTQSTFLIDWHLKSFALIKGYLEIKTIFVETSTQYKNQNLKGQERIIDICLKEKADNYINSIGGQDLYDDQSFIDNKIKLYFLKSDLITYKQYNSEFVPWLSIIDVLMFNGVKKINKLLGGYSLS
jgi:hypothetical protein